MFSLEIFSSWPQLQRNVAMFRRRARFRIMGVWGVICPFSWSRVKFSGVIVVVVVVLLICFILCFAPDVLLVITVLTVLLESLI
jgi:hypothetical protein